LKKNSIIIVEFDGYCNFCSNWVKYIQKKDLNKKIIFSNSNSSDSIILTINNYKYYKSDAIIKLLEHLNYQPIIVKILKYVPKIILDCIYLFFSKYRFVFFGKRKSCYNPTDEHQ
tara:strand:- start:300 stop:644 length:345 start_codon:yes stop_codon:yes gene_type:complete